MMAGFDEADVVLAIGYDLVEHSPEHWNPGRDKKIICIDSVPAEIDAYFMPEVELVGDIYHVLARLGEECRHVPHHGGSNKLRDVVLGRFEQAKDDDDFPVQPPRALFEIRKALGREDILISDVGLHKLWIGRMFPAYEPNTVLIANGLAGMGFAVPAAIAAKLVHPDRRVVTVNGDGGFLMNAQELETAVRLKTPFVNVIWENSQYGSIVWKQDKKFGDPLRHGLHEPRLREAGRGLRHAGLALRLGRRVRRAAGARAHPGRAVADRAADRLLDRRRHIRGTWNGDSCHMSIATEEQTVVDAVEKQLYIGGEWRDASGGATLEVIDPATEEPIAEVADATPDDAMAALDAAVETQKEWARFGPERPRRDPLEGVRAADRARRRAGPADDARDGQAGGRVEGRDRLRGRLLPLVLGRGAADRRQLQAVRERHQPRARDEAAGRARA